MNNEQILGKALCKAKGYPYGIIVFPDIFQDRKYYSTIFSHDFAKAFWGWPRGLIAQSGVNPECKIYKHQGWQYHLQRMVLEKEPLKYLEKFLGEK